MLSIKLLNCTFPIFGGDSLYGKEVGSTVLESKMKESKAQRTLKPLSAVPLA
jgi:hypothetical protein